jgi:hypothetical protein
LKQPDKIENGSLASRPLKTAGDGGVPWEDRQNREPQSGGPFGI